MTRLSSACASSIVVYVTLQLVWSYTKARFFSTTISGAQRLLNGNTLITAGAGGRMFEVTREGAVVWEYVFPMFSGANQSRSWPSCSSRVGIRVLLMVPYNGLAMDMFGSPHAGWLKALNASRLESRLTSRESGP